MESVLECLKAPLFNPAGPASSGESGRCHTYDGSPCHCLHGFRWSSVCPMHHPLEMPPAIAQAMFDVQALDADVADHVRMWLLLGGHPDACLREWRKGRMTVETLLSYACVCGRVEVVDLLLAAGARVGLRTSSTPSTELEVAHTAENEFYTEFPHRRQAIIARLRSAGAELDVNGPEPCSCLHGKDGEDIEHCARTHPLELPTNLGFAITEGDVVAVRTWLGAGGHVEATTGSFIPHPDDLVVTTMLMLACTFQHAEVVGELIAAGCRVHAGTSSSLCTPWELALERVGEEGVDSPLLRALQEAPAVIEDTVRTQEALQHTADLRSLDVEVGSGARVVAVGLQQQEFNGFVGVCKKGSIATDERVPVQFGEPLNTSVMLKPKNLCAIPQPYRHMPLGAPPSARLVYAVWDRDLPQLQQLLALPNVHVDHAMPDQDYAFHDDQAPSDPASAVTMTTPLISSCALRPTVKANLGVQCVRALLNAGANPNYIPRPRLPAGQLDNTFSPLAMAARFGNVESVTALLDAKASITGLTASGLTPLVVAVQWGQHQVVELLLERGANAKDTLTAEVRGPEGGSSSSWTPLHFAANTTDPECGPTVNAAIVRSLIKAAADPKAVASDGRTCLMMACARGKVEVERLLRSA